MYLDKKFDVKSGEEKLQEIQDFCKGTLKGHLKILEALKALAVNCSCTHAVGILRAQTLLSYQSQKIYMITFDHI